MLPRLYNFKIHSPECNGYGFFNAVKDCKVTEEKNGEYFCKLTLASCDRLIKMIQPGLFIKAKANHKDSPQFFEILEVQIAKDGTAEITANHIKQYFFNNVVKIPSGSSGLINEGTAQEVFYEIINHGRLFRPLDTRFITGFDTTSRTLKIELDRPTDFNSVFNDSGGFIDTFGGEFYFDNEKTYLKKSRGSATNKIIRYGSNISDYTQTLNNSEVYTHVYPYAILQKGDNDVTIEGDMVQTGADITDIYFYKLLPLDFSNKFSANKYKYSKYSDFESWEAVIKKRLNELTENYIKNRPKKLIEPNVNIKVTYQAELDKLQDVGLCDTVKVVYGPLQAVHTAQVIKTVYDSVNERYIEMELGEKKVYLNDLIKKSLRRPL